MLLNNDIMHDKNTEHRSNYAMLYRIFVSTKPHRLAQSDHLSVGIHVPNDGDRPSGRLGLYANSLNLLLAASKRDEPPCNGTSYGKNYRIRPIQNYA